MFILKSLTNNIGLIIILAFIMSKTEVFKKLLLKEKIDLNGKIILSLVFGLYGIMGTYTGIPINGALANSRVIGVFVGGLLGGPFVGIGAGLIAGIHRYLIEVEGFTALACMISTIAEGTMGGFLKSKIERVDNRIIFALNAGILAEILQMIIILIVAKPFEEALNLVKIIGLPMILINGLGISIFIGLTDNIFKEIEAVASYQAQLSLKIANRTLQHLRRGLNEDTAFETAKIIKEMTSVTAVAFTDTNRILTHIGTGEDHHHKNKDIMTNITKEVLESGEFKIASTREDIGCNNLNCKLSSAIIAPLMEGDKIIGVLKLYKDREKAITPVEIELAKGLVLLFSTQLELSRIDKQSELITQSELKALQAQINPHFLFNAINTIVSLTRTKPDKARELLIHLGDYFRNNLHGASEFVSLNKEIENINSYLEIEKARFGDKLNIIYNIEDGIDCRLYPLMLQPIVENAVKHGVLEKVEGGTIEIIAEDLLDKTLIIIKDDGVGIDKETLDSLFLETKERDSIGLLNVNNRLKNRYGEEYGLEIKSSLNEGTTVILKIPKIMGGF